MFSGLYTALVTPFREGVVDADAFSDLIERQVAAGVDGIVPVGTTGESPTLSHDEHLRVIELAVRRAAGRVKVLAGTGSNATSEAIEYTQAAEEIGADGALIVAPYYNKPSQEGLFQHYRAIAQSTELPIMLYSIPSRCGVEIAVETCVKLAESCSNIVSIKEAGGRVERVTDLRKALPESFTILSGDDGLALPFIREGAVGLVSVASNLVPAEVKAMVEAARAGDWARASELEKHWGILFRDLFIETNPVPIKTALARLGYMTAEVRLPLVGLRPENEERLMQTLKRCGVLS